MVAMKLANLPKKESADVVDFCSSLEPKFHSSCFKKIGSISKQTSISNDIVSAICKNAPAEFKDKCLTLKEGYETLLKEIRENYFSVLLSPDDYKNEFNKMMNLRI